MSLKNKIRVLSERVAVIDERLIRIERRDMLRQLRRDTEGYQQMLDGGVMTHEQALKKYAAYKPPGILIKDEPPTNWELEEYKPPLEAVPVKLSVAGHTIELEPDDEPIGYMNDEFKSPFGGELRAIKIQKPSDHAFQPRLLAKDEPYVDADIAEKSFDEFERQVVDTVCEATQCTYTELKARRFAEMYITPGPDKDENKD